MTELLLLELGLFGLAVFMSFNDKTCASYSRKIWLLSCAIVATMLAVPIYLILLAAAKILTTR